MLAGAWLGGQRGVLLLQSSGVGNCINMLSLPAICHMPLLMLVTMRGDWGEFNPWQIPMGQGTQAALEAMGVIVHARGRARSRRADGLRRGQPRLQHLAAGGRPDRPARARRQEFQGACAQMTNPNALLHRRDVVDRTAARSRRASGHRRSRRAELGRLGRRRPPQQFSAVGRDGRRRDDGPRPRAGAAEAQGAGHHRRRRDADEPRRARHHRGARSRRT